MSPIRRARPCILIYSPLAGHGHLDSWNDMFIDMLLAAGWRVLALTPDGKQLGERRDAKGGSGRDRLQILTWHDVRPGIAERIWLRLRKMLGHCARRAGLRRKRPNTMPDPEASYLEPIEFAWRVRGAISEAQWRPAFVFNMYMDLYRTDNERWVRFGKSFKWPWGGIRFVPHPAPTEGYYQIDSCVGMCFLDDAVSERYQKLLPTKVFTCLPDITDARLPDEPTDLAREVTRRAEGRKVVFLGGTIGGNKNLARWIELIALSDPEKWFFLQIGEINLNSLTQADAHALAIFEATPPENLLIYPTYLPDERAFNDVIKVADIVFAVYRNFKISSNMLGKAAAFEKPILVADNYLMGRRVIKYGIGKAVPENDSRQMLAAATELLNNPVPVENFAAYRADFSIDNMREVLMAFLDNRPGIKAG